MGLVGRGPRLFEGLERKSNQDHQESWGCSLLSYDGGRLAVSSEPVASWNCVWLRRQRIRKTPSR